MGAVHKQIKLYFIHLRSEKKKIQRFKKKLTNHMVVLNSLTSEGVLHTLLDVVLVGCRYIRLKKHDVSEVLCGHCL